MRILKWTLAPGEAVHVIHQTVVKWLGAGWQGVNLVVWGVSAGRGETRLVVSMTGGDAPLGENSGRVEHVGTAHGGPHGIVAHVFQVYP